MATLKVHGIEVMEERLDSLSKDLRTKIMPRMLEAGAGVMIGEWKSSIRTHHHVTSGGNQHMVDAVKATDIRYTDNGASIEVYPQGTDSHRINQAQKAYILHHGRKPTNRGTKGITGDKFVTKAEKSAKPKVAEAMQKALDRAVAEKG